MKSPAYNVRMQCVMGLGGECVWGNVTGEDTDAAVVVTAVGAYCEIRDINRNGYTGCSNGFRQLHLETEQDRLGIPLWHNSRTGIRWHLSYRPRIRRSVRRISFQLSEFVDLADGRRIMLRDDREWQDKFSKKYWENVNREYLTEQSAARLSSEWYAQEEFDYRRNRLLAFGIHVEPISLRDAPAVIEFGPHVLIRLQLAQPGVVNDDRNDEALGGAPW
ncbi:hypothetical protein [Candidatus Poriferisodalis sp.]|uniref:hypothetical protein n=1 Tax=Candidatus Poriferisodalis sp. TaxID=3101277 RepID=UPI003B029D74